MKGESDADGGMLLVLSAKDVTSILQDVGVEELIQNQADAFVRFSTANPCSFEAPLRTAVSTTLHTHLFMPCRSGEQTALKCVAVPKPDADGAPPGLPASAFYFDPDSGKANVLVNVSQLTAVRTAAGCLAASVALQPSRTPETTEGGRLLLFGSGNQAKWHARLFCQYYRLKHIDIVTTSPGKMDTTRLAWQHWLGEGVSVGIMESSSAAMYQALSQAQFVCCCTPSSQALFDWQKTNLRPDVHFSLIGAYKPHMQEVPVELIQHTAGRRSLSVDSVQACSHEAGDLLKAQSQPSDWQEIGRLMANGIDTDVSTEISVFKSVGFALQDLAILGLVVERAKEEGLGTSISFF